MGTILNWTLYGVLLCQFCKSFLRNFVVLAVRSSRGEDIYTYNFPDDGRRFKCLGMCAFDTFYSSH